MQPTVDLTALHPMARKAADPDAPAKLRLSAAKGVLPGLKPGDVVTVIALLTEDSDPEVASTASASLRSLPSSLLDGALASDLPAGVVDTLVEHHLGDDALLGRLLQVATIHPDTVIKLAQKGSEIVSERIAVNEERLIAHPAIIEALYLNHATRMSTADRILELAVRNDIELSIPAFKEAAAAIRQELIAEPSEDPTPDDIFYKQTEALAESLDLNPDVEDTHTLDDEGNEVVTDKAKPLWVQIADMTVSQKIRRAILGTPAERMMLVRDTNRLVASAAIRSPLMKDNEVAMISASRSVSDDVLRIIAQNREWTRNHQVKFNLVCNPRTPLTFAAGLIGHLREHELRTISKSKNVPGAVASQARQHLQRKQKKG